MASPETMPRFSTILRPSIPSVVTISIAASCLRRGSKPTPLAPARECCKLRCKVLTPRQPSGDAPIEPQPFSAPGDVPDRPRLPGSSEERRGGKELGGTDTLRVWPDH